MKQATEEKRIHLRDYWRLVYQSRWTVLTISAVVLGLVAVATFMQTEIYRATASVEIQPRAKSISPNADFSQIGVMSYSWSAEEKYVNTQMEVLRSRGVAQMTLERLGFLDEPEFAELSNPAIGLTSRMTLRVLPETYIVELGVDHPDPATAQLLANGVAETYINLNVESAVSNARRVIKELYTQIDPITEQIAERESARLDLFQRENYYGSAAQGQSIDKRITQLEDELTTVQIRLGERESVLKGISEIEAAGGSYESVPIVANDTIVRGLKEQRFALEQQLEKMSAALKASHPETVATRVALAEIPRKIEAEAGRIITKARTGYAVDKRREVDLRNQLQRTREEGMGRANTVSQLATLDSEIRELRRIYELINTRIKEIDLNQNTIINNLQMHEEASLPQFPVRPRKFLNLAAGLLLGLFLGIGSAFFIDYLDNTIRDSEDIERFLELPLLAMVPKSDDPGSTAVRESMQTLRTSVLFGSKGRTLRTILVTSAGPGEGKSRTAVNLARTLASSGERVLLIDADLRRPTIHKHLNLARDRGLTNYMMGQEGGDTWRRYTKPGDAENLEVLTCGPLPPKPVELFGAERFSDLIEQVKREYNWVIIDSPPVASLADTLVLATLAEMTVFVIQHKKNDRDLIRRSVEQLHNVKANMLGAVLNAVDLKHVNYGDYYYASYSYTQENESDEPARSGTDQG